MKRLRFSNSEIKRTVNLVRWHMFYYPDFTDDHPDSTELRFKKMREIEEKLSISNKKYNYIDSTTTSKRNEDAINHTHKPQKASKKSKNSVDNLPTKPQWSDSAVRRFLKRVGPESVEDLFALRIADAMSNPASLWNPNEISALQQRIAVIREQDMALKVSDLDITGNDLQNELKLESGPKVGWILNELLEHVLEYPLDNEKNRLIELAKEQLAKELDQTKKGV